jgi:histidinol-phosphate aminotransferase
MTDIKKLVRPNILKMTPYSCARDEFKGIAGIFLDANENPYGKLNRYPDPYQRKLKDAISGIKGISPEKIFLGNGSDEIIDLCFRIFCNPGLNKVLIFPPTYGMYEVSASINDVRVLKVPLTDNFRIDMAKAEEVMNDKDLRIIFICSPNNPTANAMDREDVEQIIRIFDGIVVIDEAYSDFSVEQSFISLVEKYNNLIVMQTFSKALGLAAARVGMAFADPEIVGLLNKIKPPYNISSLNQSAALESISNAEESMKLVRMIISERSTLQGELEKFSYVKKIYPSDANFLLIKVDDANRLYDYLIMKEIIVRNRNSIIDDCIRITIGKKEENEKLIAALRQYVPLPGAVS